jgi:hypothetical protein
MAVEAPPQKIPYWQQLRAKQDGSLVLSYRALRNAIGVIGFGLPIVLFVGAKLITGQWPQSVSGYYFSPVRNVLVGALCTVSVFLMAYSGYTNLDRWVTNVAGAFALGVAFFPTANPAFQPHWISIFHHVFSTLMLIFLALMSLQFARTAATEIGDLKHQLCWLWHTFWHGARKASPKPASATAEDADAANKMTLKAGRNKVYVWCARLIIVWIICAAVQNLINAPSLHLFFWCEVLALWTFSLAWLTKGQVLRKQEV